MCFLRVWAVVPYGFPVRVLLYGQGGARRYKWIRAAVGLRVGAGLPGLAAVWPSLRLRRPPTPDDVVVARVVSAQCRSNRPVILLATIPVVAVIRSCLPSRRGLAAFLVQP